MVPSNELPTVVVRKSHLYTLFALAFLGVAVTAGVASGFAVRAGVARPVANAVVSVAVLAAMYPYLKIRGDMRGTAMPTPLWKWVLVAVASAIVGNFVFAPLVLRLL